MVAALTGMLEDLVPTAGAASTASGGDAEG
jgi:hypothetical protein